MAIGVSGKDLQKCHLLLSLWGTGKEKDIILGSKISHAKPPRSFHQGWEIALEQEDLSFPESAAQTIQYSCAWWKCLL